MRCYIHETGEYFKTKKEAISAAKKYLSQYPADKVWHVCYAPETKESIRNVGKGNYGAVWFLVGIENTDNVLNFIQIGKAKKRTKKTKKPAERKATKTMLVCPACGRMLERKEKDEVSYDGKRILSEYWCDHCRCTRVREVSE